MNNNDKMAANSALTNLNILRKYSFQNKLSVMNPTNKVAIIEEKWKMM